MRPTPLAWVLLSYVSLLVLSAFVIAMELR